MPFNVLKLYPLILIKSLFQLFEFDAKLLQVVIVKEHDFIFLISIEQWIFSFKYLFVFTNHIWYLTIEDCCKYSENIVL